jgi:transcription-repair coupling factor (superfamily II helicase)
LGAEQSGNVSAVGLEMYMKLLNAAVSRLKGKQPPPDEDRLILTVSFEAGLPRDYISDERQRLNLYRRIGEINDETGIADIEEELRDRFGGLPDAAISLLELQRIRLFAATVPLRGITIKRNFVYLEFERNSPINPASFPEYDFIEDVQLNAAADSGLRVRLTIDGKKDILKATQKVINGLRGQ